MIELVSGLVTLVNHARHLLHEWNELALPLRWAGTGFILISIEFNFRRAIAIWPAIAAFAMVVPAIFMPVSLLPIQGLAWLAMTIIGFYYRPHILKKYLDYADRHPVATERLLGADATCAHRIDGYNQHGTVRLAGQEWQAHEPTGQAIDSGQKVRIIGRRGMTLLVEDIDTEPSPLSRLLGRLVGMGAMWICDDEVVLAEAIWPAIAFPEDDMMGVGQAVKVVGVKGRKLLVERDHEVTHEPGQMVGMVGVCREAIRGWSDPGVASLNGVFWRARPWGEKQEIAVGELVRIIEVDGAVVLVESLKNPL